MTKFANRHYEAIATTMQIAHPGFVAVVPAVLAQWTETCRDLAETFAADNPQFDVVRFMRACIPGMAWRGAAGQGLKKAAPLREPPVAEPKFEGDQRNPTRGSGEETVKGGVG